MPITRLGLDGYGVRLTGSFAGKDIAPTHPVGKITRLSLDGYMARRAGDFSGKSITIPIVPSIIPSGGIPEYHPYIHKVRVKYEEEQKPVIELIEQIVEAQPPDTTDIDLEIALRMQLKEHHIRFRKLYWEWLEAEFDQAKAEKLRLMRLNAAYALLLH